MEVVLPPELERKVRARVGDAYKSPSDVIEEALKAFFGPETLSAEDIADIDRRIAVARAEVHEGLVIDGDRARDAAIRRLKARRPA